MLKNIIGGVAVGIANIIPGVSGGTIMVLLGLFNNLTAAISNIFSIKTPIKEKKDSFIFLLQIGLGIAIGLVGFAKILEFLFAKLPNQTLCWFAGLILFSLPMLKSQELAGKKIAWPYFILGLLVIFGLTLISPENKEIVIPLEELLAKNINLTYLIFLILLGMIGGATMIFPGVSGSMVLLVLGYYHLFKGYVANVTSFKLKILIPLGFIAIGIILGIILSSVLTNYLLKTKKRQTISVILGLVLASGIVIIPITGYNIHIIITSIISFILGGMMVYTFNYLETKKLPK